jgi:protein involved in polysaccharide export with SLBB domain
MLLDQDELILFDLYQSGRKAVIATLVDELRVHTGIHSASQEVVVSGNVRYPGTYPLVEGMQIEDLINAAGGLTEKAFQLRAELSRTEFNEQQERYQYRVDLNLSAADSLNFALKSRDELQVKTIPDWAESEQVVLTGEVKFPGTYPIYRDDTLASLLERAGGVTELAYAPGAIFTRTDLKKQQAEQLIAMQERLAEDIAKAELVVSNQGGDKKDAGEVAEAQKLLSQLKSTSATGRLVIDLDKVLANDLNYSIPLQEGDTLYVPGKKNSVTIVGEVQLPISQIYESQLDYWDYIERSGGTTEKADEDRVYIIKANGGVQIPNGSSWFTSNQQQQIAPGDTIVVPLDADRLNQTLLWRDVSQIFYQIALGAAAVGSL